MAYQDDEEEDDLDSGRPTMPRAGGPGPGRKRLSLMDALDGRLGRLLPTAVQALPL